MLYLNASRIPPGLEKLLAKQQYYILFCMSLLCVVRMVGIVDTICNSIFRTNYVIFVRDFELQASK